MTLKTSSLKIIKLKSQTYLPYQLHQLPKWFNKYKSDYFNLKGYCYISLNDHYSNNKFFNYKNFRERLTFNKETNKSR